MAANDISPNGISRPRNFSEWCGLIIVGTVIFTVCRLALFVAAYEAEPGVNWNPWADLPGMLGLSPIGWAIMGLIGPLWLALGGLIGSLVSRTRRFHWLTFLATIIFGFLWPKTFWAWMSV